MKRLALIALLLLTAGLAEARQVSTDLAVVYLKSNKANGAVQGVSDVAQSAWVHDNVTAILNEWRVDYLTIPAQAIPTGKMEWYRTGRFIIGPDTITARAVLHERVARRGATFDYPQYRPDSLFMARIVNGTPMLPSVPSLMLLEPGPSGANQDLNVSWHRTTACSVGVSAALTGAGSGSGAPHECEGCIYTPTVGNVSMPTTAVITAELDKSTVGGVLPLLAVYMNGLPKRVQELGNMPGDLFYARWEGNADTTGFYGYAMEPTRSTDPDTAFAWKRLNIGWNVLDADGEEVAAAQQVMSISTVALGFDDGQATPRVDFQYEAFFVALAALDSLLGGDLIGGADPSAWQPKVIAVSVDGAFARCAQQFSQGVYLPDSAAIKATVDSLVSYGIPFLVGVNVDSVAAYPYEKAWWNKGGARFTPQVWAGVHGANGAASYVAGRYTLRDLFGHARQRQAYGPADGAANDTSFYSQLKFAFARCDSLFPGRSSRFLLPPFDDHVPTNAVIGDSILIAARLAGATGIRINGLDTLRHALQTTNVQGRYFGLPLIAHAGGYVTGGSRLLTVPSGGSAGPYFVSDSGYVYHPFCDLNDRILTGIVRGPWHGYYNGIGSSQFGSVAAATKVADAGINLLGWTFDPNKEANRWRNASRVSTLKASASGLGGDTYIPDLKQPQGEPLRPDWWTIRSVDGYRAIVNAVAGRTLIRWGYPEEIEK